MLRFGASVPPTVSPRSALYVTPGCGVMDMQLATRRSTDVLFTYNPFPPATPVLAGSLAVAPSFQRTSLPRSAFWSFGHVVCLFPGWIVGLDTPRDGKHTKIQQTHWPHGHSPPRPLHPPPRIEPGTPCVFARWGAVRFELLQDLLKARPNSVALVVSTENLTQNLYHGNERSMLLQARVGHKSPQQRRRDAHRQIHAFLRNPPAHKKILLFTAQHKYPGYHTRTKPRCK